MSDHRALLGAAIAMSLGQALHKPDIEPRPKERDTKDIDKKTAKRRAKNKRAKASRKKNRKK